MKANRTVYKRMSSKPKPSGSACRAYRKGFTLSHGYRLLHIPMSHPYRAMARGDGDIFEHRLVMAQHLGRLLQPWEVVHHKNQDKQDNRIENLELLTTGVHTLVTRMEAEIKKLQTRVEQLEKEIERLKLCQSL